MTKAEREKLRGASLRPGATVRLIKQSDLLRCPHAILTAEHYRESGKCRCDDPEHTEMQRWGYKWRNGRWQ